MQHLASMMTILLALFVVACGSDTDEPGTDTSLDTIAPDGVHEVSGATDTTPLDTLDTIEPLDVLDEDTTLLDTTEEVGPLTDTAEDVVDLDGIGDATDGGGDLVLVDVETIDGLPLALPFVYERPDEGEPVTQEEIDAFTLKLVGLLKQIDYYTWLYETNHGVDASTGYPDYLVWWQDVMAIKEGDKVTFSHYATAGAHNAMLRTAKVLMHSIGGYFMHNDQDPMAGELVEQFSKAVSASMLGMVYDADDPVDWLMSRNIATFNHEFTLPSGKQKAVDYTPWYYSYESWNAERFLYPDNPYWGAVWVTNMRSKDDVPYLFRIVPWLEYVVALAPEGDMKDAAAEALALMKATAKDIVDSGYLIRTKDAEGNVYVPEADLASFVFYDPIIPNGECAAKLCSALIGYGEPLDNECGTNGGNDYELLATGGHYFNYHIINNFHMAAIQNAIAAGYPAIAKELLEGLAERIERYMDPDSIEPGKDDGSWPRDLAQVIFKGAAVGYPATSKEIRHLHEQYGLAIDAYAAFPNWDLWDPSVPDGEYPFKNGGYRPSDEGGTLIRIPDVAEVLEYCWSPYKNPAGVPPVNCEIVADMAQWPE